MTSWNRHSFSARTYTMCPKSQKKCIYLRSYSVFWYFFSIFRLSIAKLCLFSCWEYKNVQYLNLSLQIKEVFLRADRKYWFRPPKCALFSAFITRFFNSLPHSAMRCVFFGGWSCCACPAHPPVFMLMTTWGPKGREKKQQQECAKNKLGSWLQIVRPILRWGLMMMLSGK